MSVLQRPSTILADACPCQMASPAFMRENRSGKEPTIFPKNRLEGDRSVILFALLDRADARTFRLLGSP
jgi:hypothetical protein